jgi:sugar phosphate isomerase/epimerase
MEIAMQLYTLREYTKTPSDLKDTLKKLSGCGYKYVETAGYYGMTAGELAKLLAEYGIKTISTHTGIEALAENIGKIIEDHVAFGAKNCCVPGLPGRYYHQTAAGYSTAGEVLNSAAEKLAENGISLSYHNHVHEFKPIGDSCGLRFILENAPLVNMQLDVGHAYAANQVPQEWIARYIDRIKTVHYKDVLFVDGVRRDYPIGEGAVDWKAVTAEIKKSGCKYIIVEHEEFIRDAWDICKTSYDNIAKFLKD